MLAGRIKSVIDKILYLWNRISQKIEGNLAKSEEIVDFNELERTRKKLAQMRNRSEGCESTGAFAMEAVRRRMTAEIDVETVATRKKTREAMNKWFFKDLQSESGVFNAVEFDRRLKDVYCDSEERPLEPLPALEDTFMAFSKSEENLFDEAPISLSGVHYKVDPYEDFDEAYSTPALPMYAREEYDFSPVVSFAPDSEDTSPDLAAVLESEGKQECEITGNNPMLQVLTELEERMAQNAQRRDAYWVAD